MQAKKRQGRKPSAKPYQQGSAERVVYYRRVAPGLVGKLDEVLDGKLPVVTTPTPSVVALLEDVDRLTKEVAALKDRLERCARATDDQKAVYWKNRALLAEGSQKKSEFDQT